LRIIYKRTIICPRISNNSFRLIEMKSFLQRRYLIRNYIRLTFLFLALTFRHFKLFRFIQNCYCFLKLNRFKAKYKVIFCSDNILNCKKLRFEFSESSSTRSLQLLGKKFYNRQKPLKSVLLVNININKKGEKPGLVVKADGSRSRGRGFEPRHRILDGCKRC
jgi:hypothetical protein